MEDKKVAMRKDEADAIMEKSRVEFNLWKNRMIKEKQGFFPIYKTFVENGLLKNISGNALKVYIYLGIYSKNDTGESWHSIDRISEYFGADKRSVKRWIKELEDNGYIIRVQKGFKRVANTFLRPLDKIDISKNVDETE